MDAPSGRFAHLALALALLIAVLPAPTRPRAALAGGPALSGAPDILAATVPLGATATLTMALRNQSAQQITPRLFEAFGGAAQAASATASPARAAAPAPTGPPQIDPEIATAQAASPDGEAEVIVLLDDQADLSAAYAIRDWAERGRYVYETLHSYAEASQRELRATLEARGLAYTPLWIVNAVAVRAAAADVAAIASVQDVAALWASRVADLGAPPEAPPAQSSPAPPGGCEPSASNACWNIARVGADRAWADFGVRGEGITVGSIDSGVRFDHPALLAQYRGSGPGGPRHDYNWFDAYAGERAPVDAGNHGTHTMGTIVARGLGADQPAVGVAPGVRWITARGCSARSCDEVDLIRAAQWMLAPTDLAGNNPRPDLRPHVLNNSWTGGRATSWFLGYVEAWRAAGIYPVFAGGNGGNLTACSTIESPGDYAEVTGVGATDTNDALASFSGIGPTLDGRLKPDLVAPGQWVVSTVADERGYAASNGTSMAAPHVAGAVALLWEANPELIGDYASTYAILTGSAIPQTGDTRYLGPPHAACAPTSSPNNVYGYGRLDVYGAVARATVDVPWLRLPAAPLGAIAPAAEAEITLTVDARMVPGPGDYEARVLIHGPDLGASPAAVTVMMRVPTDPSHAVVTGQVTSAEDGSPIEATVRVEGGATVSSDATGRYSVTLPPATRPYRLIAAARGYVPAAADAALAVGERRTLDFALSTDRPRLAADAAPQMVELGVGEQETVVFPVANAGTQPLSYSARVLEEHYGVWRSDEPEGPAPAWTDPPATAVTVELSDDGATGLLPIGFRFPYYYATYERFSIAANGLIALAPLPDGELAFDKRCLPLVETAGPAIVPLRLDLDPSKPGARVSYAHLADGLLVTWEEVPLYESPATRVSFQALLMPDGRISLRYRDVGPVALGDSPSAGLQGSPILYQSLGCRDDLAIGDGLTVELRPQAPATVWMHLGQAAGSLAPSADAGLTVTAGWIGDSPYAHTLSGAVELRSNDPAAPTTRLTVRMRVAEAPYALRLLQVHAP